MSSAFSFDDIGPRHSELFDDSHVAMRLFMWHPHQEGGGSCSLHMLNKAVQPLTGTNVSHQPCWLRGQSLTSLPSMRFALGSFSWQSTGSIKATKGIHEI